MVRDVPLTESLGLVVQHWRSTDEGLFLKVRGHQEEVRLVSRCGRCHWIVHEKYLSGGAKLLVTCHGCGEQMTYVLEGSGSAQ
jgi:RNase P subunit RPR2